MRNYNSSLNLLNILNSFVMFKYEIRKLFELSNVSYKDTQNLKF
jgi:hypothetical protein